MYGVCVCVCVCASQGLNDLFDFKQRYPEADLDPFLKKSSQFFQDYIERGLKNIETERQGKLKTSSSTPNSQYTCELDLDVFEPDGWF